MGVCHAEKRAAFQTEEPEGGDLCCLGFPASVKHFFGNCPLMFPWEIPSLGPCGLSGANATLLDAGMGLGSRPGQSVHSSSHSHWFHDGHVTPISQ